MSFVLKTGYIEFARFESSADATHVVIVNLPVAMAAAVAMAAEVAMASAVAMAAEVHCQREPSGCTSAQYLSSSNYQPSQILYSPSLNHRVHQKLSPKSGGVSLYTNKVFEQFCRFISAPALPVMVAFLYVYIQSSIETAIYEAEKVKQS